MIKNKDKLILLKEALQSNIKNDPSDEIREEMKGIFPTIWNDIVGYFHNIFPTANPILQSEIDLMKKYTNAKFNILLNSNPERQVFMYPTKYSTNNIFGLIFYPLMSTAASIEMYTSGGSDKILRESKNVNGKVIIPELPDIYFNVIQSKGFFDTFYGKEKERFAMYLSQIGAIANIREYWGVSVLAAIGLLLSIVIEIQEFGRGNFIKDNIYPFIIAALVLCVIGFVFVTRSLVFSSDDFVKKMGYGKEYANAIQLLSQVRTDSNIIVKFKDTVSSIVLELVNLVESIAPISPFPGKNVRIKNLLSKNESYYRSENMAFNISRILSPMFKEAENYLRILFSEF